MPARNTARGYGSVNRVLHWLIAALILTAILLGLIAVTLPRNGPEAIARVVQVFSVHKTVGITVLILALLRVVWVMGQTHPRPLHPERRVETWLADSVHWALYGGMVLMPLSGWLLHSAAPGEGFADILWPFGQRLPGIPQDAALTKQLEAFHGAGWWLLAALIVLHVAGAVKHVLVDRDATLARMTRPLDQLPEPPADTRSNRWLAPFTAAVVWLGFAIATQIVPQDEMPVTSQRPVPVAEAPPPAAPAAPAAQSTASAPPTQAATTSQSNPAWTVTEGTLGLSVNQGGSPVAGSFGTWIADIHYDPASGMGHVDVTVDIASLQLGTVSGTATGPDFLNAAAHPKAQFTADITRVVPAGTAHQAVGTLTLAGQERPASLPFDLTIEGNAARAQGKLVLDRRQFGIGAGYADESTVGFAVPVTVDLTATRR
ncbi:cytochrome B [Paracoccus suum]|uniref:Cytochrome B n=1 Tax=Paracoccus suum TaxID=2259340 RepID=A0A344PPK6_9RHOB|nr:cytochrome B [Paracoccus suum]